MYRRESGLKTKDFAMLHEDFCSPALTTPGVLLRDDLAEAGVPEQLRVWWEQGKQFHLKSRDL